MAQQIFEITCDDDVSDEVMAALAGLKDRIPSIQFCDLGAPTSVVLRNPKPNDLRYENQTVEHLVGCPSVFVDEEDRYRAALESAVNRVK